jgi:ribosome-associated toxin RatA of RatAB toxin-antitoxin module
MLTIDEQLVRAPVATIFRLARDVERWPQLLPHYRFVRFHERTAEGGVVEMSANRPFAGGSLNWPTWWVSRMAIDDSAPVVRFRHVRGITAGMDVAWTFDPVTTDATRVRIVHTWDGPYWPLVGPLVGTGIIGPVFVHGIASRTLAGLARAAEAGGMDAAPTGAAAELDRTQ